MNTYTHTDNPIAQGKDSLEVVGGLLSNYDLTRFKVYKSVTLFEPDFTSLQKNKCPICGRKLYINVKKTIARCKSKKSNDKFFISVPRLLALGGSLNPLS